MDYQTCDSFFVESAEMEQDGVYAARRSRLGKARIDAETQMEIADEMTRMVSEEYQEDILDHMEYMEVRNCPLSLVYYIMTDFES